MDIERFQYEAGLPIGNPHRPHESLMSIICAWGIRFTLAPELSLQEESFVQKALISVQSANPGILGAVCDIHSFFRPCSMVNA